MLRTGIFLVVALLAGPALADQSKPATAAESDTVEARLAAVLLPLVVDDRPDATEAEHKQTVNCLMAAFAPLSAADKQMLIDIGVDPSPEQQDALESRYPGINDAVEACF